MKKLKGNYMLANKDKKSEFKEDEKIGIFF